MESHPKYGLTASRRNSLAEKCVGECRRYPRLAFTISGRQRVRCEISSAILLSTIATTE